VFFLKDKSETQGIFKKFARRAQNEFDMKIKRVRSDNGTEFRNTNIEDFLDEEGIKHEFSVPYTPQQNGVVERKNRTLIEAARAMLDEYKIPEKDYWAEAVNTACHAINLLYLHKIMKKTAYELLTSKKPKVDYFRVFGCKCFILNKKSKSSKFAPRVDEGFLLGYGTNEHDYRVFNKTTGQTEITIDVTFDESDGSQKEQVNAEIVGKEELSHQVIKKLATGEVKPVEQDNDDDAQMQVNHDPHMHHGSADVHGDASTSRSDHGSREQANQDSPQVEDGNQDDDKARSNEDSPSVNQDYDSEDDGPIQTR
jgi:hypothetical protein